MDVNHLWEQVYAIPERGRESWLFDNLTEAGYSPDEAQREIAGWYEEGGELPPSHPDWRDPDDEDTLKVEKWQDTPSRMPYYDWRIPVTYHRDKRKLVMGVPGGVHMDLGWGLYQNHGFIALDGHPDQAKYGYTPGLGWFNPPHPSTHAEIQADPLVLRHHPEAAQNFARADVQPHTDDLWADDDTPSVPTWTRADQSNGFQLGKVISNWWVDEEDHRTAFVRIWNMR